MSQPSQPNYETITPAGALLSNQCNAAGHAHTNPDVPLRIACPVHGNETWWCGQCAEIWCPAALGGNQPHNLGLKP